ncbi:MAG: hypothetical protein C7B45_11750 [Sulfobacillus acidophilus]|uniref:Uncharacterized protein n=1 Tax=Sulfobacillus acidophilus TaxID=53633 RepID=A0A2T2WG66_9FIRM|nr:MAG: hypothetical protein C7B45_11750 [Sulfobacillus acidophilus]
MNTPLIDGEVLREFFGKADIFLTAEFLSKLSGDLEQRTHRVRQEFPSWPQLWDLAPATRRLSEVERTAWLPHLDAVLPAVQAGDLITVLGVTDNILNRPKWLVDWLTFWIHVANPRVAWWARWVYGATTDTGALLLVLDNPSVLHQPGVSQTYQAVQAAFEYLATLLDSTQALRPLASVYRAPVMLAVVYTVYMFTMASWKLTEEFTQVLPPFPVVVRTLLGVNRWEG